MLSYKIPFIHLSHFVKQFAYDFRVKETGRGKFENARLKSCIQNLTAPSLLNPKILAFQISRFKDARHDNFPQQMAVFQNH